MTLSVMTLNLWHDNGPYDQRKKLIRAWIDQLNPDLIGAAFGISDCAAHRFQVRDGQVVCPQPG